MPVSAMFNMHEKKRRKTKPNELNISGTLHAWIVFFLLLHNEYRHAGPQEDVGNWLKIMLKKIKCNAMVEKSVLN